MFCDEVLDVVEAVAAGDLTPDLRVTAHLASCLNCRSALESAREIDRMLQARAVPRPPTQFTTRTLARVRRARWRSEQFVDMGFNVAITALVLLVIGGVWLLFNRTGLVAVSGDAINLMGSGGAALARRLAPSLPLYIGASALVASALAIWWWAERDGTV